MRHLGAEYYVGLLSAAIYFGATHQKPARFQIISNKRIKHSLKFGQVVIELIYKSSLLNLPTKDFVVSTGYLKVATPELIAMDLFKYSNRAGGISHIATVLSELVENLEMKNCVCLRERELITHVQYFQKLEYQMVNYNAGERLFSPDRLDAMVWALWSLFLEGGTRSRIGVL